MNAPRLIILLLATVILPVFSGCHRSERGGDTRVNREPILTDSTRASRTTPAGDAIYQDPRGNWNRGTSGSIDRERRYWLHNMYVLHGYDYDEIAAATGMDDDDIDYFLGKFDISRDDRLPRPENARLLIAPYPGGRHPRIGYREGAVRPQRDTKVSVFTPWGDGGYVVYDLPEAVWSHLGLTYLAHTHLATIWDDQLISLNEVEWERNMDGSLEMRRRLPNGIEFSTTVVPMRGWVAIEFNLHNGTGEVLTELNTQMCLMLGRAKGFNQLTNDNKHFAKPYVACRSVDGNRWIITGFTHCKRTWANEKVPCMHSDPKLPDCDPGEEVVARGILAFYEGDDIETELLRLDAMNWQGGNPTESGE